MYSLPNQAILIHRAPVTGTSFLDINNLNNVHGGKFPRRASHNPIMFAETCSSYRKNYQPESENAAQVAS